MPTPATTIQLMSDVPFGIDQKDVRLFASTSARDTYFTSKVVKTFQNCVYQRQTSAPAGGNTRAESMKVACQRDEIENCNYLRFQNADSSNKWFYAFILMKNYINANTTEIVYQIDDWQTYFLDGELLPCIVEREHATYEEENTVTVSNVDDIKMFTPEPIVPQKMSIESGQGRKIFFSEYYPRVFIITNPWNETGHPIPGEFEPFLYSRGGSGLYDNFGTYATVWIWEFPISDNLASRFIGWVNETFLPSNLGDVILDAYISPFSAENAFEINENMIQESSGLTSVEDVYNYQPTPDPHAHTIRNKKLLFSPFRKWIYRATTGEQVENNPEDVTQRCDIKVRVYPDVLLTIRPETNINNDPWTRVVSFSSHNQAAFTGSAYASLQAQKNNQTPIANTLKNLGTVLGALKGSWGTGANAANVTSGWALQALDKIAASVGATEKAWNTPNFMINTVSSADACYLNKRVGFEIYSYIPSPADCEAIDDYFDFYGYNAGNVLKIPRLEGRQYWNYVKTQNCKFDGNCPAESERAIEKIFDAGVRVWHVEQGNQVENPVAT